MGHPLHERIYGDDGQGRRAQHDAVQKKPVSRSPRRHGGRAGALTCTSSAGVAPEVPPRAVPPKTQPPAVAKRPPGQAVCPSFYLETQPVYRTSRIEE